MMANDLCVGGWRGGLPISVTSQIETVELRLKQGFRLFPWEYVMVELINYLESYDEFTGSLLVHSEVAAEEVPKPTRVRGPKGHYVKATE